MAPSARAVHKAEAKYGVTADYPDLQLHAAAANGNVGLVKYALMHGQPVNSVLNGVLPIHIAASSGNEQVVQMLIDAGADVNAARLPRKYNADRSKAISSIGAAGSTPLHFAAANGHAHIVSLLLSHGANPNLTEKHGLTPEDLASEAGHVNVVTVFRLWRQDSHLQERMLKEAFDKKDQAFQTSSSSPGSATGSQNGPKLASSAASIHSVASSTGRSKLLSKQSMDNLSMKGKRIAKVASNPNFAALIPSMTSSSSVSAQNNNNNNTGGPGQAYPRASASNFAQAPIQLRQNPAKSLTSYMQHINAPLVHHVINLDKSRRPSLPSVFEKAAHPSHSIKTALGLTSGSSHSGLLPGRSGSHSSRDNDPFHLDRPRRSSSKNSLAGLFRSHHNSKDKNVQESYSQPLSPAASTFFTGDDELEQAERDMFLRATDANSGDERGGGPSFTSPDGQHTRRTSVDGFSSARSRAGSASSAATSQSAMSHNARPLDRTFYNYPLTAPPTQTAFNDADFHQQSLSSRPGLSPHSSGSSVVIPQPIPPPPSSSTQPFFSKAAISAAHNNPPISRPGFYRPRKSSQLSTAASTVSLTSAALTASSDIKARPNVQSPNVNGLEAESHSDTQSNNTLVPPALVIRRPTLRDNNTTNDGRSRSASQETHFARQNADNMPPSRPISAETTGSMSPPNSGSASRTPSIYTTTTNRHLRSPSDGIASSRPGTTLPNVRESPESQLREQYLDSHTGEMRMMSPSRAQPSATVSRHDEGTSSPSADHLAASDQYTDARTRATSIGSDNASSNHDRYSSSRSHESQTMAPYHPWQPPTTYNAEGHWRGARGQRSDSVTTDTRTSRSGSLGEAGAPHQRFFGFDYSSSPTGSVASFKYHPSTSTTATSIISSPPRTAGGNGGTGATTVTHAQAQNMVKRKEEELLSYDTSPTSQNASARRPSLSQQLAAYGDSLAIERELQDAERHRQYPHEQIALSIPEAPASAKYSWEILGKETRTAMPVSKGQRASDIAEAPTSVVHQQKLWTHRMVSPYEVPLNRPGVQQSGHRHTLSNSTITSSGKPLTRVQSNENSYVRSLTPGQGSSYSGEALPTIPQSPALSAIQHPGDQSLKSKPSSNLSISRGYLAPPQQSGGSDLSIRKTHRMRSLSPSQPSPRTSGERDRPSATYVVVAGPGSEPTDSANSSLLSEPRSSIRTASSATMYPKYRHASSRSDPPSASHSPDTSHVAEEQTPRAPQILRLETVSAPKFHIEERAGGEAAPSPIKPKFGSKLGKLFR